jgi:hypothetical protein
VQKVLAGIARGLSARASSRATLWCVVVTEHFHLRRVEPARLDASLR